MPGFGFDLEAFDMGVIVGVLTEGVSEFVQGEQGVERLGSA